MAVIDPNGLFEGQRLRACSDIAQNYYPRLYCAANGYARLELDVQAIIRLYFRFYTHIPTVDDIVAVFEEYVTNYLAFIYQSEGRVFVQFATKAKFLPRRKTREDNRIPPPPPEAVEAFNQGYIRWKAEQAHKEQSLEVNEFLKKISEKNCHGTCIGEGIGMNAHESESKREECASFPTTKPDDTKQGQFSAVNCDKYLYVWNTTCAPFPPIRVLGPWRTARLKDCVANHEITPSLFAAAIEMLKTSSFCRGEGPNHWRASFDWLIMGDNIMRVLEGTYSLAPDDKVVKELPSIISRGGRRRIGGTVHSRLRSCSRASPSTRP